VQQLEELLILIALREHEVLTVKLFVHLPGGHRSETGWNFRPTAFSGFLATWFFKSKSVFLGFLATRFFKSNFRPINPLVSKTVLSGFLANWFFKT